MKIYDFIGIGFGPSNVSVAIAAEKLEINNCLFVEKKSEFAWYPGMLLDTSRLQVVFLKDLITLIDPKSKYTFLNYLFS